MNIKALKEKCEFEMWIDSDEVSKVIDVLERYEKALKEIAEETGTPYAEIARKALKDADFEVDCCIYCGNPTGRDDGFCSDSCKKFYLVG